MPRTKGSKNRPKINTSNDYALQQYMIASKAYIESDLLTFCISVIALIVSIFTMANIKWNMSKG